MGDMALDVPPPSADAEQGMDDMPDPTAGIGEEPPTDPVAGGPEDDPLEGDPNALSAGQGDPETQQFVQDFQNSSQSVKDRTMKYFNSQEDNGGEQPANTGMPPAPGAMPESKFNFKHIIDEVFNDIQSQNPFEKDTTRLGKTIEDGAETESRSPFIPR